MPSPAVSCVGRSQHFSELSQPDRVNRSSSSANRQAKSRVLRRLKEEMGEVTE